MQTMAKMLRDAGIKFIWNVFTNSKVESDFEEFHFFKQRLDVVDYIADADYTVLLSDSEGLPYTVQESLQYQVPCIVTDVGGCTELIKDGINGYVVPLDMNFNVNKLLNIPKCPEYDNHALEKWLNYLGNGIYIEKKENNTMKKCRVLEDFTLGGFNELKNIVRVDKEKEGWLFKNDTFECEEVMASYLANEIPNPVRRAVVEIIEEVKEEPIKIEKPVKKTVKKTTTKKTAKK